MRWWLKAIILLICLLSFFLIAAVTMVLELINASSTDVRFVAVVALVGAIPLFLASRFAARRVWSGAAIAWAVAMVSMHFIAFNPVKPFREFYEELRRGMTEPEIKAVLAKHFPTRGRFAVPRASMMPEYQQLSFTLDPTNDDYDSEFVVVKLRNGRMIEKDYLGD